MYSTTTCINNNKYNKNNSNKLTCNIYARITIYLAKIVLNDSSNNNNAINNYMNSDRNT